MDAADSDERRPKAVLALTVVLFLEAAAMLGIAVWTVVTAFGESSDHLVASLFLAAIAAGASAFLWQAGRGMLAGRSWSRSATVVWQVLQMGVAFGTYNGAEGPVPIALALLVPAIVALVLVFRQSVRDWVADDHEQRGR